MNTFKVIPLQREITESFLKGNSIKDIANEYDIPITHVEETIRLIAGYFLGENRRTLTVYEIFKRKQYLLKKVSFANTVGLRFN